MREEQVKTSVAWLLAAAFVAAGAWASYWAENRNDQYQLIWLGWCLRNGGTFYLDCWENKPPGIAWINALGIWLWPDGQFGAWLLPGIFLSGAVAVFWKCVRTVFGAATAAPALLLATSLATVRMYDGVSINPDFYAFVFELIAASTLTVALCRHPSQRRWPPAVAAGLAFAAATTVKQVGFVGLFAAGTVIATACLLPQGPAARNSRKDSTRSASIVALAAAGFGFGVGVVVAVLGWQGVLREAWYAIYTYSSQYLPTSPIEQIPYCWPRIAQELSPVQLWLWLAGVGALATLMRGIQNPPPRWAWIMLLWLTIAGWFALHGPSMSMRYWHGVWAPMLWLASAGIEALRTALVRNEKQARWTIVLAYATLILLLATPLVGHYRLGLAEAYLSYSESPTERERLSEIGRAIAERVPNGEAIYIWAYDVGPYLYSERRPVSRYTYPRSPESAEEVLNDLEKGHACAILMPHKPTGAFARHCDDSCQARLAALLERYMPAEKIGPYQVYLRPPTASKEGL